MVQRRSFSLKRAIGFGVSTIVIFLVLATLWNVLLFYDWGRLRGIAPDQQPGMMHWAMLTIGYVLFVLVALGIVYLFAVLISQIVANQRQQNFIDSVSHELRSPLTSIKLHLETLQRRQLPDDKREEFLALMLKDVARLSRLIEQILEAARRDQSSKPGEMEPVAIRPVVETVVATLREQYDLPDGAITLSGPALKLHARSEDVAMVLNNLIDNAIKYSEAPVQVTVAWAQESPRAVEITVSDRGIGISRAQQRRVFQRFYRAGDELTRSRKGTGLGLYLVKEVVRSLHGQVSVQSAGENQGAVFIVRLPVPKGTA